MALVLDGNGPITGLSSLTFPGNAGSVTGLAIAAIAANKIGTGALLQVVEAVHSTSTSLGSTVDGVFYTYGTASITPVSSASKILIIHTAEYEVNQGNYPAVKFSHVRGGTIVHSKQLRGYNANQQDHHILTETIAVLDSPSTTSSVTYTFRASNDTGSSVSGSYAGRINTYASSKTILLEIA